MRSNQSDIENLLKECRLGNQRAQMTVYQNYYHAMYNTSYRIVKNTSHAEDIMQESFLTAFTKLDDLKMPSLFGPWLKRIVINNSVSFYHKNKNHDDVSLNDILYKAEPEEELEESYDWTVLKAKEILETMKQLKDNYRIILSLSLIEGYDYDEIASIMGISYTNCRTTIYRAKQSLKQKLNTI